jgi:UDP-3-O-[3-hydroxymyristoyl] glucosamine N-acyltransferase
MIGNHVTIGGQVGIARHINIPDGIWIDGKSSMVNCRSKMGKIFQGNPAMSIGDVNHFDVLCPKIPKLFDRVLKLEKYLSELLPRSESEHI